MIPADEMAMKAALAVLTSATLTARMMGYEGASVGLSARESARLADLMDAVHNIPDLQGYDEKWGMSLAGEYMTVCARVRDNMALQADEHLPPYGRSVARR